MMCADMLNFERHVRQLEEAGTDLFHFDLMDAHFAPNMPMGLGILEQLRPKTAVPFDVHLMVENNDLFIHELSKIGVEQISVHVESARHLDRTLSLIREKGIKAGVALNPATPLSALDYVLDSLDFILIMTVNPGFAGQKLVKNAIQKIADCRRLLRSRAKEIPIQVDGNVSFENIPKMVDAGASILVAGTSSVFHKGATLKDNFARTREAIATGLKMRRGGGPMNDSTTMKALVLHAVGDLRYESIARPQPGPGAALVRIGFCGVCGSDIPRIFSKGTYHFPTVCGHEFAGTVEAVGEGVNSVHIGDRVAVFPLLWCGRCAACEKGQYVQCHDYDYLGSRSDGGFAQYVVAPERNLIRVPAGVSLEEAAMTEPAAVALHAVKRVGTPIIGQTVAIFGAGPIGLMVALWSRAMGAAQVIIFDLVPEKLELARKLGFTLALNSRAKDPVAAVNELTGGDGAHLCIDGAGVPATLLQAMGTARRGGAVVLLGNPSADVTVPANLLSQLMRREVRLLGTWNSDYSAAGNDDDWRASLAAMANGSLPLKPLITHSVALPEAADVLAGIKEQREFYSKVLIHP